MKRVVHTGDTHIGCLQYQLIERKDDFIKAFRKVIEESIHDGVDAVVHAGDIFESGMPNNVDIVDTINVLQQLKIAEIPFLAVVGNHDRVRGIGKVQWIDILEKFGLAIHLGQIPVCVDKIAIYGMDDVPSSQRKDIDYQFEECPEYIEHKVLVAHGQFVPFTPVKREDTLDINTIIEESNINFDCILLGDDHERKEDTIQGVRVTYCGSTERKSTKERKKRSYNLIEFDDHIRVIKKNIPGRNFEYISIKVNLEKDTDHLYRQLKEHRLKMDQAIVSLTIETEDQISKAEIENYCKKFGALKVLTKIIKNEESIEMIDVAHFIDPIKAVEEEIKSLGLTAGAQEIEILIRDGTIAESNLRNSVKDSVMKRLELSSDLIEDDNRLKEHNGSVGIKQNNSSLGDFV
jgi:exonuclease SbcD